MNVSEVWDKIFSGKKKKPAKKVMIVEDDALLAKALAESFITEKFEVTIVGNGLEVPDVIKKFFPDIILLDLILPGIDGFSVLRQLKEEPKTKNIPVAILSNLGEAGDVKSTKALGADEYFIKANTEIAKIIKYVKDKLKI